MKYILIYIYLELTTFQIPFLTQTNDLKKNLIDIDFYHCENHGKQYAIRFRAENKTRKYI